MLPDDQAVSHAELRSVAAIYSLDKSSAAVLVLLATIPDSL
jgi:hypothetical protein